MIDLFFLKRFLTGIFVSILLFIVVESIIRITKINNHREKSNLYLITLLSSFSGIFYALFSFDIYKNGDKLVFSFPNIKIELENLLRMSLMSTKEGVLDLRVIILLLIAISLFTFFFTVFLSKFYIKKKFNLRKCEDEKIIDLVKKVCHENKLKIPKIMIFDKEINAFVFGFPPILAVSKELIENISEKELELVLRHEMNHIKNHDNILKPLLFSLRVLFFYNPVVHILNRKIAKEREFLADRVSDIKKEKVLFLYTLVKLNELQIGKKKLFLSYISSPFVKSNLKIRTETLLSENKRTGSYPYLISLWIFAILIFAGIYASGNLIFSRGILLSNGAITVCSDTSDRICGEGAYLQIKNPYNDSFKSIPASKSVKHISVFGSKESYGLSYSLSDPNEFLILMVGRLYSIGIKKAMAIILIFPLLFKFCGYILENINKLSS